jgi:glycosyltransferase involved in cell wall biosynthesis
LLDLTITEEKLMPRRVLAVLEAGNAMPSGIVRGLIYKEFFQAQGIHIRYVNRVSPILFRFQHNPSPKWQPLMPAGLGWILRACQKIVSMFNEHYIAQVAKKYDVVYISKAVHYGLISKLREKAGKPIVLDFGDAVWLPNLRVKRFEEIMQLVDAVTTDNDITAAYTRRFNPNCTVIPDCPQVELFDRYRSKYQPAGNSKIILGWVGSFSTTKDLFVIWEVLERLFAKYDNLHLRLVGVSSDAQALPPFQKVRYSCLPNYNQTDMIREVLRMDIGLFPLEDDEAGRVRGILKPTVYMAGEVAVVGSAVGQNIDFIQDGVNGMLASSAEEWEEKLGTLINDSERRQQLARTGLELVRKDFTVERSFSKLLHSLQQVTRKG